ncbi:PEP-CTERM sorting domain-containing protein (plasmid) [Vibrio alfacsensis]|uniref:PEP-CTERM sorting domain-containing protein n=1 Tax=Vibrio alfacsensis TaxID=1074311 RepID=UPI002ADE51DC|nr:PEP-CTERM sorting domain-containing protein [Vibrio alfacsensis]WQE79138.1 PEP-CTERM sorting domain-containing protein [Vibrio alfacsensis]
MFEEITNDLVAPSSLSLWTDDLDNGNYVEHRYDFDTLGLSPGVLYDNYFDYSLFSDFATMNLAKVGAFQGVFNLSNTGHSALEVDLSLGRIAVVPEPAALSMLGAGILVRSFFGYRRRKASNRLIAR